MNLYMGYFENEENTEGDNPPIGIFLSKNKDELLVKYAMNKVNSQLFISKYQHHLPDTNADETASIESSRLPRTD